MYALALLAYAAINPTAADHTITLTGRDLTIEQIVEVARNGAKVQLSPEAQQREADNYGLLLEATAEGVPVYWFNRGTGSEREDVIFAGDPLAPNNKKFLEDSELATFKFGAQGAFGPEIAEEELV